MPARRALSPTVLPQGAEWSSEWPAGVAGKSVCAECLRRVSARLGLGPATLTWLTNECRFHLKPVVLHRGRRVSVGGSASFGSRSVEMLVMAPSLSPAQASALLVLARARGQLAPAWRRPPMAPVYAALQSGALTQAHLEALQRELPTTLWVCSGCRAASRGAELSAAGPQGTLLCPRCRAPALTLAGPGTGAHAAVQARPSGTGVVPSGMGVAPSGMGVAPSGMGVVPSGIGSTERRRTLGPYQLEEELGRGCYGIVFRAHKVGLPRRFALKVIDARKVDPEDLTRFQLEAQLASKLENPGIVGVLDVGQEGSVHYYVMEFVEGPNLSQLLEKRGPLAPKEAAEIVEQLARTVHYAHQQRVVHRDLKPANVLLEHGRPRITDFGLARDQNTITRLTASGEVLGTPYYMAPEQLMDRDPDHRADIYALGVILFELLTNQRPYVAANLTELAGLLETAKAASVRALVPQTPETLDRVVRVAMARQRRDRYMSAGAFAEDLASFLRGEEPSHASGLITIAPKRSALGPLVGVLFVLAALIGVSAATWHFARQGVPQAAASPEPSATTPVVDPRTRELERARRLARSGAPLEEAAPPLRELLSESPDDHGLRLELARLYRRRGAWSEASAQLETLIEGEGEIALAAKALQAELLECQGRLKQARALLLELDRLDPAGARGAWARAVTARLAHDRRRHARLAQEAVRANERSHEARFELGLSLLAERRRDALKAVIDGVVRDAPDHPRTGYLRWALANRRGDLAEAQDFVERVLRHAEGVEPLLAVAKIRALLALRRSEALDVARKHKRAFPEDLRFDVLVGEAGWQRGEAEWSRTRWKRDAIEAWQALVRLDAARFSRAVQAVLPKARHAHVLAAAGAPDKQPYRERHVLGKLLPETIQLLEVRAVEASASARDALREALLAAARGDSYVAVREAFDRARGLAPRDKVVALERLRMLVGREALDVVRAEIESARGLGVDERELKLLEADFEWLCGRRHVAAPIYEKLAYDNSRDRVGSIAVVAHWTGHRDLAKALRAAETLVKRYPYDYRSRLELGSILLGSQRGGSSQMGEETARSFAYGGAVDVRVLSRYLDMKVIELFRGEKGKSRKLDSRRLKRLLDEHAALIPLSAGPWLRLEACKLGLGLVIPKGIKNPFMPRVRAWLREALEVQPDRGETHFQLGKVVLREGGSAESVLAHWRRGLKAEPRLLFEGSSLDGFRKAYGDLPGLAEFSKRRAPDPIMILEPGED